MRPCNSVTRSTTRTINPWMGYAFSFVSSIRICGRRPPLNIKITDPLEVRTVTKLAPLIVLEHTLWRGSWELGSLTAPEYLGHSFPRTHSEESKTIPNAHHLFHVVCILSSRRFTITDALSPLLQLQPGNDSLDGCDNRRRSTPCRCERLFSTQQTKAKATTSKTVGLLVRPAAMASRVQQLPSDHAGRMEDLALNCLYFSATSQLLRSTDC